MTPRERSIWLESVDDRLASVQGLTTIRRHSGKLARARTRCGLVRVAQVLHKGPFTCDAAPPTVAATFESRTDRAASIGTRRAHDAGPAAGV